MFIAFGLLSYSGGENWEQRFCLDCGAEELEYIGQDTENSYSYSSTKYRHICGKCGTISIFEHEVYHDRDDYTTHDEPSYYDDEEYYVEEEPQRSRGMSSGRIKAAYYYHKRRGRR